jgi:hypothetical protein
MEIHDEGILPDFPFLDAKKGRSPFLPKQTGISPA